MPILAYVRWFDASYQRGECTADELVPRVEVESAGLLAFEDAETISLALDRYDLDGLWRYIEHIPKVNVRSITRVEVNMPGKKMNSVKRPKIYEALKDKGMSKAKAARISNAQAKKAKAKRKR